MWKSVIANSNKQTVDKVVEEVVDESLDIADFNGKNSTYRAVQADGPSLPVSEVDLT